jgi:uridylate kinase
MSAIAMPTHCETYERSAALRHLAEGRVVVLGGGGAAPFFTTDTTAALRAAELGCEAILKATNVDGVYSDDPKRNKAATRYERLTHAEALRLDLKIMDATAFALARETRMPIIVFSIHAPGAIAAAIAGKGAATHVVP